MGTNIQEKIIDILMGILCSAFISGFISAHNQIALFTLKRPLSDAEAKELENTAYASLHTFISMYINNPANKILLEETFGISLEKVEKQIQCYLKSRINPNSKESSE